MKVYLSFKCLWDKANGESLGDYRKKLTAFREHVNRMQLNGNLPFGDIYWITGMVGGPYDTEQEKPEVAHTAGTPI